MKEEEVFILPFFKVVKGMKFVFLDIDGVLNHQLYYKKFYELNEGRRGKVDDISSESIEILNSLHEELDDVYYVISSSWRKGKTIKELQDLLDGSGFTGRVIGKTPGWWLKEWQCSVPRGVDIYAWINKYADKYETKYVIFDDDSDMMLWQKNHYFQVDGYCGITPNIIYRASNYLNGLYQ